MALPNPSMDAVPFTPLTAAFVDDMIENIESLAAGTGLSTNSVPAAALATNAITLGYAEVTAVQSGITSATDLTGLSVTVTVPAGGRRVRITGFFPGITSSVTTDRADLSIKEGSTFLNSIFTTVGGQGWGGQITAIKTPSAGSHTYKLNLGRTGSGSLSVYSDAVLAQAYILVEAI